MRKLLLGGAVVAVLVLLFAVVCRAECATTPNVSLHAETFTQASTGRVWMRLYKQVANGCAPGALVTLASCYEGQDTAYPFADMWFTGDITGPHYLNTSQYFSGAVDRYRDCNNMNVAGADKYIFWNDYYGRFANLLSGWAGSASTTLTFYVGQFDGATPITAADCTANSYCDVCPGGDLTDIIADVVAVGVVQVTGPTVGTPRWKSCVATAVSAPPSGCAPECNLPTDAVFDTPPTWGAAKELYR